VSWYAFKGYNGGKAIVASAFDGAELNALGMHGYATAAIAQVNPNSVNVFQSPVVNAAIDDYNNARDISPTQANNPTNPAAPVAAAANTATSAAEKLGSGTVDDVINFLKQSNIWERGAEIIAGLILLYVGLKAVATPAGQVPAARGIRDTAATVAKVVK
jgi:hypothetical protein